ncbi:TonB-dependent receptor [Fulvivirga lutimaris]|nr:TonB-dependent receptor [Fulvivirga lutimaris]
MTFGLMISLSAFAQERTISGTVIDGDSGEPLIGANVLVAGTTNGTITDFDGNFKLNAPSEAFTLKISFIGFEDVVREVGNSDTNLGEITMVSAAVGLDEIMVIASVAVDRKTPVALSTVKAVQIESKIGSQEFPEILKSTPGVFATKSGGGFGDGRINIRGFNDENVAVMINGIPVNDMENGNVYWSNWAGLADAATSVQVQRGLGASKVAVPSIGGTINILSKASDRKKGASLYVGTGNDAYSKVGFSISSGLTDNGWAFTASGAKIQQDGYVDGTEALGFSYFLNIAKQINDAHEVTFTAVGAKQRHGQRQNQRSLAEFEESDRGIKYNGDWGYKNGQVVNVEDNFYHKPQMSLNHYWTISPKTDVSTALYFSTGTGGGGGTGGDWGPAFDRVGGEYGTLNIDALVDLNEANQSGEALAWQRASRNDHIWYGALSTLSHELSDNLTLMAGLDLRSYTGSHFYEVTDLLGGDYIVNNDDDNNPNRILRVGDKYNYNYDGKVGWTGAFAQVEYDMDKLSTFLSLSLSNTSYKQIEYFNNIHSGDGVETDAINFFGYQVKGGATYRLDRNHNVYANIGYFSKAPFYRNVFTSRTSNNSNPDAINEEIFSAEIGYGLRKDRLTANVNVYRTQWDNRAFTTARTSPSGNQIFANISGINALHQGIELDGIFKVNNNLSLTGMLSLGDWRWVNNVENVTVEDENNNPIGDPINVFIEDLRVGNSAQTTAALGFNYTLLEGFSVGFDYNYYDNLYAQYDPLGRTSIEQNVDAWQVPAYGLVDLNVTYKFEISGFKASLYGNVYNLADTQYVADANDGANNDAQTARVYYGFGRTWNLGLKVQF